MKRCSGCRYHERIYGLCKYLDRGVVEHNSWDGRTRMRYGFRPSLDEMRRVGGQCGLEAVLYTPTFWRRVLGTFAGGLR